jgi:hypothetical protein
MAVQPQGQEKPRSIGVTPPTVSLCACAHGTEALRVRPAHAVARCQPPREVASEQPVGASTARVDGPERVQEIRR